MRAKPGIVDTLNRLLTIEVTAVNQYFLQSEIVRNWGYDHLADRLRAISMGEMRDIEELVKHILYLEGLPNLQRIDVVKVGETVLENLELDLESEQAAIEALTEGVNLCVEVDDYGTRSRLEEMIRDEETHIDWLETQIEALGQLGTEQYLAQQLGTGE
ncbi:MAG: bacterioferritin [Chloroflexota bacterium]|nr:bacterioferritin [Chloroflexota bacterium]MDE2668762.1 bacterioferritin [Chloroflexota bacterium]